MADPATRDYFAQSNTTGTEASPSTPLGSLRPFFRRKLSRESSATHGQREVNPATSKANYRPHAVLKRMRSTTWSGERLGKPPSPAIDNDVCQPCRTLPPFAEAFRHAILHDKLEITTPAAQLDSNRGLLGRYSPAIGADYARSPLLGTGSRKRADSGTLILALKFLIVTDDGCILQYSADGPSNRLPERILELGPSSIAIASDALPGRHWVLNVVRDGREDGNFVKSSKHNRLSRQRSSGRMHATDLLLAFGTDHTFNDWLIAIRREIEAAGGLAYHPNTTQTSISPFSQPLNISTSPQLPSAPFIGPIQSPERSPAAIQAHAKHSFTPRSMAESSVYTTTDLDGLRDSSYLSSRSFNSRAGSVSADSDNEASSEAVKSTSKSLDSDTQLKRTRRPAGLKPIIVDSASHRRSTSCSGNLPSPQFPRTPTLGLDAVHQMAGAFAKSSTPSTPGAQFSPGIAPFAFLRLVQNASLPEQREDLTDEDVAAGHEIIHAQSSFAADYSGRELGATQDWPQHLSDSHQAAHPPPPHSLAPRRRSSLKLGEQTSAEEPTGLGILDISPPRHAGLHTTISPTDRPKTGESTLSPSGSLTSGSIWVPPPAEPLRDHQHAMTTPPQGHTQRKSSFTGDLEDRAQSRHGSTKSRPRTPRLSTPPVMNGRFLRSQRSMPALSHAVNAPTAPPPTKPLPALPTPPHTVKPQHPKGQTAISLPLLQTAITAPQQTREARAATTSSPISPASNVSSPLASNPISPTELKYAHRLSAIHGFPSLDFDFSANSSWPSVESDFDSRPTALTATTMSKTPPPSTWQTWKSYSSFTSPYGNDHRSSGRRSRPDSGVFRTSRHNSIEDGRRSDNSWFDDERQRDSMASIDGFRFPFQS